MKSLKNKEIMVDIALVKDFLAPDDFSELFPVYINALKDNFKDMPLGVIWSMEDAKAFYRVASISSNDELHSGEVDFDFSLFTDKNKTVRAKMVFEPIKDIEYLFFHLNKTVEGIDVKVASFIDASVLSNNESLEKFKLLTDLFNEAVNKILKLEKIKNLTIIDDVTGLYNTRHLYSVLNQALVQSNRYFSEFSLIFIDLDRFKEINDNYNHLIGSKILKMVGEFFAELLRKADMVFRYGGDEFVIYLPHTSKNKASVVVNRLMKGLRKKTFSVDGATINLTASFGVSGYPDDGKNVRDVMRSADEAMYKIKKTSRNGVEFA